MTHKINIGTCFSLMASCRGEIAVTVPIDLHTCRIEDAKFAAPDSQSFAFIPETEAYTPVPVDLAGPARCIQLGGMSILLRPEVRALLGRGFVRPM